MAKYQKKKDLMLGNDQFSAMSPELESSTGFPGEASLEEVEEEQAAGPDVGELQKRLAKLESEATALTGLVKAQGDKPDTKILDRLSEIKREQTSLQDLVKASPVSPTAPTESTALTTTPTVAATPGAEAKPNTLLESFSAAKKPTEAPGQIGAVTPSQPLAGLKPEPEKPEDTLLARLKRAETGREEARKRADIGQLAEMVGRSLTQIGAAQQGMRTGVDLSGIAQGKGIDWEARRAEIAKDYETELASVSKEREQLLEKERRAEEAKNNKELLAIKKQELALQGKKATAEISKMQEELALKKQELLSKSSFDKDITTKLGSEYENNETVKQFRNRVNAYNEAKGLAELARQGNTQAGVALAIRLARANNPTGAMSDKDVELAFQAGDFDKLGLSADKTLAENLKSLYDTSRLNKKVPKQVIDGSMNTITTIVKGNAKLANQVRDVYTQKAQKLRADPSYVTLGEDLIRESNPELFEEEKATTQTTPTNKMQNIPSFKSADEFLQSRGK